ncbi:MAG: D-glycero-beta-D-manno-heptose 1-phosphate adenylyltransferase [Niabella sp.]
MKGSIENKILLPDDAAALRKGWKSKGEKTVFTNGVFDILHAGHVRALIQAASFGNRLIVGLNSDSSVKRLKGDSRPIIHEKDRALLLAALSCIDAVVLFEEDTPIQLIKTLMPDVLVKSADYKPETIVGAKEVIENGGEVKITPLVQGLSTTLIIEKIKTIL